jgi:hypothetical protein
VVYLEEDNLVVFYYINEIANMAGSEGWLLGVNGLTIERTTVALFSTLSQHLIKAKLCTM